MKIDFSKIAVPELPKKTVKIQFLKKDEEFEIQPMTGEVRFCYFSLDVDDDKQDVRSLKRLKHSLSCVVGMTEADINKLIAVDWLAAINLSNEVFIYTREYELGLSQLVEDAEKNLPPDGAEQTHTV